jgi:predicted nucleic acid-binding protein
MEVLIDTNIALDWLLRREPRFSEQRQLWQALDAQRVMGYMPASSVTDVFYIARRLVRVAAALAAVQSCLAAFRIIMVDRETLVDALALFGSDFEDNVQIICALSASLDAIVTRDEDGFGGSPVRVLRPAELIARLGA